MALNGLAEYRSSYLNRNDDGTLVDKDVTDPVDNASNPSNQPAVTERGQLPGAGDASTKPPLSPRHLSTNTTYGSSQPTSPTSSQGMDDADRARYQSIMRASVPEARQPLTPPPPSSTGLKMNSSSLSVSSSKLNVTNQTTLASNNSSIFASVSKSMSRRVEQPDLQFPSLKYSSGAAEKTDVDHRHSTTVTAAATAAATDKSKDEKVDRQYYTSRPDVPAFASRSTHDPPSGPQFTYGQSPYSHLYNQQSHEQRLQIHMASISEKYSREFRAVDERIAGYLGRFLRRAKHGPEQERQLLQVLQVEIRDLLRRTLDSEAEVIHLTELLKESHARMQDVTSNSDSHLERILSQQEERLREQKKNIESDASEKVLSMETKFKRERLELEEKLAFAESEMNHKLKTAILECEQKIYERNTENQRAIKQREREMESERDNFKHQLGNLTAELQSEKRSYLELQEAMGKVKQAQAAERLQVQQQLVEVVQTWENESKKREEAARKEMERGFEMRLAAERELGEKEREKHIKNLQEGFAIDMGREMTVLSDKYSSHHKGEVANLKQKMAFDYETRLSKQKSDFEDVIRSLKLEVDEALKKIRVREEELRRKEADVEVTRVQVDRKKDSLREANDEIRVKEHMSWIEQIAGKLVASSTDKINDELRKEKKEMLIRQMKLENIVLDGLGEGGKNVDVDGDEDDEEDDYYEEEEEDDEEEEEEEEMDRSPKTKSKSSRSLKKKKRKEKEKEKKGKEKEKEKEKRSKKHHGKKKKKKKKKQNIYSPATPTVQPPGWGEEEASSDDSGSSVASPFFDDVDARISEILDAKLKQDAVKKASRRESLSLDRQSEEAARMQAESIGMIAEGIGGGAGAGNHYFPHYSSLLSKQPYSYPQAGVYPNDVTGIEDLEMRKSWNNDTMAAAWMPRSFYQEYVRTSKKKG